jgi:hypothetical protein
MGARNPLRPGDGPGGVLILERTSSRVDLSASTSGLPRLGVEGVQLLPRLRLNEIRRRIRGFVADDLNFEIAAIAVDCGFEFLESAGHDSLVGRRLHVSNSNVILRHRRPRHQKARQAQSED